MVGLALDLLAHNVFAANESQILLLTGAYAAAWVLGFIMPGAPGGLGVREAVLLAAFDPIYGSGVAVGLTLSPRLVTTLGDAALFLGGLAMRPQPNESHERHPAGT